MPPLKKTVFWCYAHKDMISRILLDGLQQFGQKQADAELEILWDKFIPYGSDNWENDISNMIKRSSFIIVLKSKNAEASAEMKREQELAKDMGIKAIPIWVDDKLVNSSSQMIVLNEFHDHNEAYRAIWDAIFHPKNPTLPTHHNLYVAALNGHHHGVSTVIISLLKAGLYGRDMGKAMYAKPFQSGHESLSENNDIEFISKAFESNIVRQMPVVIYDNVEGLNLDNTLIEKLKDDFKATYNNHTVIIEGKIPECNLSALLDAFDAQLLVVIDYEAIKDDPIAANLGHIKHSLGNKTFSIIVNNAPEDDTDKDMESIRAIAGKLHTSKFIGKIVKNKELLGALAVEIIATIDGEYLHKPNNFDSRFISCYGEAMWSTDDALEFWKKIPESERTKYLIVSRDDPQTIMGLLELKYSVIVTGRHKGDNKLLDKALQLAANDNNQALVFSSHPTAHITSCIRAQFMSRKWTSAKLDLLKSLHRSTITELSNSLKRENP